MPRSAWGWIAVAAVVSAGFPSLSHYSRKYTQDTVLIGDRDDGSLLNSLEAAAAQIPPAGAYLDFSNGALAKLLSLHVEGKDLSFSTFPPQQMALAPDPYESYPRLLEWSRSRRAVREADEALRNGFLARRQKFRLSLWPDGIGDELTIFAGQRSNEDFTSKTYITAGKLLNVINKQTTGDRGEYVRILPPSKLTNQLSLVSTPRSASYYYGVGEIGLFQAEDDPMVGGSLMAGVGRRLLFEVVNPTPDAQLLIEMSSTLIKGEVGSQLPAGAMLVGNGAENLGFLGRGSARLAMPLVEPAQAGRHKLIGIDFGRRGSYLTKEDRRLLMTLFGRDVRLDNRAMNGFTRDVSLVSAADLARRAAPPAVASFPEDLKNAGLFYSGLYEDGWTAEAVFIRLSGSETGGEFTIRGVMPGWGDQTPINMTVLINGAEAHHSTILPGEFSTTFALPSSAGTIRVDLRFDHTQMLPDPDSRPVSVKLGFVGWEAERVRRFGPTAAERPMALQAPFSTDAKRVDLGGISADGWVVEQGHVTLAPNPRGGTLAVRGLVPMISKEQQPVGLSILVDGELVAQESLIPGKFAHRVRLPPKTAPVRIELHFENPVTLPAPDNRRVGAHLDFIGWEPEQVSTAR